MKPVVFPKDFKWGVATSAQQIEGATKADGRGESIWDRYEATPGKISDGTDSSVACDHYNRWQEDIELMKSLNIGAYRFSTAWPRVLPDGRGRVNQAGLDFYCRLVDGLLENGIEPFLTLYHWDLPQVLQDEGGWASRSTAEAFVEYAALMAKQLGDRVKHWATHNEPWCIAALGYEHGHHAPGHSDPKQALAAAHHVLLSHGWASKVIRQHAKEPEVGIVIIISPAVAASDSAADKDAARAFDASFNRWYLDPIFRGQYPEDGIQDRLKLGHLDSMSLPFVEPGDLEAIAAPLDFLGVNYYSRNILKSNDKGQPEGIQIVPKDELTDMGWEVYPDGLYDLLMRVHSEYGPKKIFITENGAAYSDGPNGTDRIEDLRRVRFFREHLLATHRAIEQGVPLKGYFAWSLLDNFEWAHGYEKRFGLFWVDYQTQRRIAKDSALWYRDVVATSAIHADQ